jgi:hypothetical protein
MLSHEGGLGHLIIVRLFLSLALTLTAGACSTVVDGGDVGDAAVADACDPATFEEVACEVDADCPGDCFCTPTVCFDGRCQAGPPRCDDGIACTTDGCDEAARTCDNAPDDGLCDDGDACTGVERCEGGFGCRPGTPPSCSDGDSCTLDCCVAGECVHELRDLDGDGFASISCAGGLDCDDDPLTGRDVHPNAPEVCDDGIDNDCDGLADVFDEESCPPLNDSCDGATPLSRVSSVTFSTRGLADDYVLSCEGEGPQYDAVYEVDALSGQRLLVTLPSAPVGAALELRAEGCTDGAEVVACLSREAGGGTDLMLDVELEGGTYYLVVSLPEERLYSLDVAFVTRPPPLRQDLCDARTPTITESTAIADSFAVVFDDYTAPSCGDSGLPAVDAVYRLSLASAQDLRVSANGFAADDSQRDVRLSLLTDCSDPVGSELACAAVDDPVPTGDQLLTVANLASGDYWLLIEPDGDPGNTITYRLDVELSAP